MNSRFFYFPGMFLPAILGYGFHVIVNLWNHPGSFQDDMRQHILGLQPVDDLYGRYFAATVPFGLQWLNKVTSLFCSPLDWARWGGPLLIALLCCWLAWRLGLALFNGTKNQLQMAWALVWVIQTFLWSADDLISSTPRAWAILFLLIALSAALRGQWLAVGITALMSSLFYPSDAVMIAALLFAGCSITIIAPNFFDSYPSHLISVSSKRNEIIEKGLLCLLTLGVLAGIAWLQSRPIKTFGPMVSKIEAINMPEFGTGGRAEYFHSKPLDFWIKGSRSGIISRDTQVAWLILIGIGIFCLFSKKGLKGSKGAWRMIFIFFILCFILYLAAHLFWLHLFHPSRYIQFTVSILSAVLLVAVLPRIQVASFTILCMGLFIANYFCSKQSYEKEKSYEEIVVQLQKQPHAVVATFPGSSMGASLPLLAHVPVVSSIELSLPYHSAFYQEARNRLTDNFVAWTAIDKTDITAFVKKYGVTHFLLETDSWDLQKVRLPMPWRKYYRQRMKLEEPQPFLLKFFKNHPNGIRLFSVDEIMDMMFFPSLIHPSSSDLKPKEFSP